MTASAIRNMNVPEHVQQDWQGIVDYIARIARIPASLVMRVYPERITVFSSSQSPGNPYQPGDSETLQGELYCEHVIARQEELLIPNALKDQSWDQNPDIKLGMISYCGLPVNWPNGEPFGTICMLDHKENSYTQIQRELLHLFRKMIENSLAILYQQYLLEEKVEQRTQELETLNHRLSQAIDQHAAAEEIIHIQKHYDELTGLPNLAQLEKQFQQQVCQHYTPVAVMTLRLNSLKAINDSYGLVAGRELVLQVSQRLKQLAPEHCYLACLALDEFCFLVQPSDEHCIEQVVAFADKLATHLALAFDLKHEHVTLSWSKGIALYPDDSQDFMDLMRKSSAAASECLQRKARYQFFNPAIESTLISRLQIENHLADALQNNELSLHYQPLTDIASGQVHGAEVLLRWNSHVLGRVPPDRFIPLAEQSGQIIEIGYFVLRTAIQQLARWKQQYHSDFYLAVNLSPVQLRDSGLVQKLAGMLSLYDLSPDALEIELTENVFFGEEEQALDVLKQLSDMGVRLSLDDFGTGYSSLSYLHKFPFSTVKIDRSFIASVPKSERCCHLVKAIVSMAKSLNLTVIAEGIENQQQADFIQACEGDIWQGFFFGCPVDHREFCRQYLGGMQLV